MIEDVKSYPQRPQTKTILDDEVWRDQLGLSHPLPGSIDYKEDLIQKRSTTYRGPLAIAMKSISISDKQEQLQEQLYELQLVEKEKKDYVKKMKEDQQRALIESTLPTNTQGTGGGAPLSPSAKPSGINGGSGPASTTTATATTTTNAAKLNQAIQSRQNNIEKIKKELSDEKKGKRWRGELSSFRSTVARSSFLDMKSSDYGDISQMIEQEKKDKERSFKSTTVSTVPTTLNANNKSGKQNPSASFMSRTGRVPIFGDVGGGNIMVTTKQKTKTHIMFDKCRQRTKECVFIFFLIFYHTSC